MSTFRSTIRVAWIPLLTWAASVGVAEVVFRYAGKVPSNELKGIYESFGDGSYKCRPDLAVTETWFSGPFDVYTDGLGLRAGQNGLGAVKDGGSVDILLIGDSQGFSQGVAFDDSIAGVLQARAAAQGLAVANASVGGHFLRNQFELVRWLHQRHRLKIRTILLLMTPRMIVTAGQYSRIHVDVDGRLYDSAPTTAVRVRTWVKTHSSVYLAVRDAYRTVVASSREHPQVLKYYEAGFVETTRLRELARSMDQVKAWATSSGAVLVLAYVPMAVEFEFDNVLKAAVAAGAEVSADAPWRVLHEVSEQLGIAVIDLRPTLKRAKDNDHPLHLKGDAHYSAVVCSECGDSIWESFQSLNLLR